MEGISKNDVLDWLDNPVTKAYFKGIKAKIRLIQEWLGSGVIIDSSNPYYTASKAAHFIGQIEGLNDALEVKTDEVIEEEEEETNA